MIWREEGGGVYGLEHDGRALLELPEFEFSELSAGAPSIVDPTPFLYPQNQWGIPASAGCAVAVAAECCWQWEVRGPLSLSGYWVWREASRKDGSSGEIRSVRLGSAIWVAQNEGVCESVLSPFPELGMFHPIWHAQAAQLENASQFRIERPVNLRLNLHPARALIEWLGFHGAAIVTCRSQVLVNSRGVIQSAGGVESFSAMAIVGYVATKPAPVREFPEDVAFIVAIPQGRGFGRAGFAFMTSELLLRLLEDRRNQLLGIKGWGTKRAARNWTASRLSAISRR